MEDIPRLWAIGLTGVGSNGSAARLAWMTDTVETLHRKMEAAAAALDFEAAKRYRDRISLMRGGATFSQAEHADTSGLDRQRSGAMGLGTSQQRTAPPPNWQPPPKPDPMTAGGIARRKPRRRGRG